MKILAIGDRDTSYLTHREIDVALKLMPADCECGWTATDSAQARELDSCDAIWLLPGTPYLDEDAAYGAIEHSLATQTPFLGTCGGFQYACVELARSLAGVANAAHAETSPEAEEPVIEPLHCSLYGEIRTVRPIAGTHLAAICGTTPFDGFHYCGYGLAPGHVKRLEEGGVLVAAYGDDVGVEAIELPEHPFFLATAFQPQVGSASTQRLHPLITALLEAARSHACGGRQLAD